MLVPSAGPVVWSSLSVLTGAIPSSIVVKNQEWYDQLEKPWWTPPPFVFPIVWTSLNAMIGWAACASRYNTNAMLLFGANRCLSLVWTPLFFEWKLAGLANLVAFSLILTAWHMIQVFSKKLLIVPYFIWLCVAFALNIRISWMNPNKF